MSKKILNLNNNSKLHKLFQLAEVALLKAGVANLLQHLLGKQLH